VYEYSEIAKELNERIKLPYDQKLELTNNTIRASLVMAKKPIIASSFGKDSVVLMHLVHQFDNTVPIVFTNTGVCFRETLEYKKMLEKKWNLKIHELKPKQYFWQIVKKHGYPKHSRNSKTGDKREPVCCRILKFQPMESFCRSYKPDMVFVGLLGDEGRQRRWVYICKGGAIYDHKSLGTMKSIPIIWWTMKDIWKYHDEMNIPRNPCYEKYSIDRTGCIPCTGHIGWEAQLARTHPKMYEKIQMDLGQTLITGKKWIEGYK